MAGPEAEARARIDTALTSAGWIVQDAASASITAARGVAIREFPLKRGFGFADYLLYVDGKAAGLIEAKAEGATLTGAEPQAERYTQGLAAEIPAAYRPLPFVYQSTGVETRFTNLLDPEPRSRRVFHFHRPETMALWLAAPANSDAPGGPSTLRKRLRSLPRLDERRLWSAQGRAVRNLEISLADDRSRALVQMATGSGACGHRRARQRALRGWGGRDGEAEAPPRVRGAHAAAPADGHFYAQGVKANVLFFDRTPASEAPWTRRLWIYDLRTNMHFTLKTKPLQRADLDDFVACYRPENRHERQATSSEQSPTGRWQSYAYEELVQRDKCSLDIFWLKDESLEDSENLPDPDVIAGEIAEDLRAALEQFEAIQTDLGKR